MRIDPSNEPPRPETDTKRSKWMQIPMPTAHGPLEVGERVMLHGHVFRLTDITTRGLVLRPMSGKLEHSVQRGWQVKASS